MLAKTSIVMLRDDADSESSEDDWEIGMVQETSLDFLKVVPKAYSEQQQREDEGVPTQRIPTKQPFHPAPLQEPLLQQPEATGWPSEEPPGHQGDLVGLRRKSPADPVRLGDVLVPLLLGGSPSDQRINSRPLI